MSLRFFNGLNRRNAPGASPTPPAAPTDAGQHRQQMIDAADRALGGNAALTEADRQLISDLISGADRLAGGQRSANPPATAPAADPAPVHIEPVPGQAPPAAAPQNSREVSQEQRFAALEANYQRLLDRISGGRQSAPLPTDDPNAHRGRTYSILRVVRSHLDRRPLDGLEAEVSQEIALRNGRSPQGVYVPWSSLMPRRNEQRAATTGTAGSLIQTEVLIEEMATLLRAQTVFGRIGGRILPGLMGPMSISRQTAGAVGSFVAEDNAGTEASFATTPVVLTPRTFTTWNRITRTFALQTGGAAEDMVREDILAGMSVGIDKAVFTADGIAPNPEGIIADTDVPTIGISANGGPLTWQIITDVERDIGNANALGLGEIGIVTTHNVRSKLKNTVKFANTASPIWETTGAREEINGRVALASTQLPNNLTKGTGTNLSAMIAGVFNQCLLALWNEVDLLVDPYTEGKKGNVILIAFQECDYVTRQPAALRKIVDIVTA